MNVFRQTKDGSLDKVYLRTCVVYRLLKKGRIDKKRAIELLKVDRPENLVELWLNEPLKEVA